MSNLNDEYQKIISDIEKNITNTDELKYIKEKISELTVLFINTVDKVIEYSKESLNNMEEKQDELEERIEKLEKKERNRKILSIVKLGLYLILIGALSFGAYKLYEKVWEQINE